MPRLFSYGTLQEPAIQLATFGRHLVGIPDELLGYTPTFATIGDIREAASAGRTHHRNVRSSNDANASVHGTVLEIADDELEASDVYESRAAYARRLITLRSGTEAWMYSHPSPVDEARVFTVRDALPADAEELAALHVQTFNETHRGGRPGGPSVELRSHQWREALTAVSPVSFTLVAEDEAGALVGFARGQPHDGSVPGYAGKLDKIYVLAALHGRGIGRLLLGSVARRFVAEGVLSMLLFGDATSRANPFYEAFNAERLLTETGEFHGGYGWRNLRTLVDW